MNTTLTLQIDQALWATVAQSLRQSELGRLFQALAVAMNGQNDAPPELLNTSGLRLAFALLSPPITEKVERQTINRANGARGGRPRKRTATDQLADGHEVGLESVSPKKSKKEDLPPTPPIEEKIKKNNPVVTIDTLSREQFKQEVLNNDLRREQACLSLHIGPGEYQTLVGEVFNEWEYADEQDWSYKHLLNTLRIKVRNQSKPIHHHESKPKTRRDITDTAATSAKDYEGPF